jgi:hypothetical protein
LQVASEACAVPLRTDIITVQPVAPAAPTAPAPAVGDARQEAFERSLSGLLSQQLRGAVLSRLSDGSALVRVAGNAARMMLPPGSQPGTTVALTLVALSPRPTFEVGAERMLSFAEAGAAQRGSTAAAALLAHSLPAELLPPLDPRAPCR